MLARSSYSGHHFLVSILALAAVSLKCVSGQLGEDCPIIPECCEEDCCGPGTEWIAPYCITSPGSLGFVGTYSAGYDHGCILRHCCEGACCGPATEFGDDNFCNPVPTSEPSVTPASEASVTPTSEPSSSPASEPSSTPTHEPSATPESEPSATPTSELSATPTSEPSSSPSSEPSVTPTSQSSGTPTSEPSDTPTRVSLSPTGSECPNDVDSDCPWTDWLNRDDPSTNGTGDWETLEAFTFDGNPVCNGEQPVAIECQAVGPRTGYTPSIALPVDASETGETIVCNTCQGFWCEDSVQDGGLCHYDYRVRFKCASCNPTAAPSTAPTTSESPTSSESPTGDCSSSTVGDFYINGCEERCECQQTTPLGQYEYICYREREEFTCMPLDRRQRFIETYISAVATDPVMQELLNIHEYDDIHGNLGYFLPWHRWYIMAIEDRLREKDCRVTVPWWKWEEHSLDWQTSPPFLPYPQWLGENGTDIVPGKLCVETGPFAYPPWTPGGPVGVNGSLPCLERNFQPHPMPTIAEVATVVSRPATVSTHFLLFAKDLEGWFLHGKPHTWIQGTMGPASTSSKAPEFFMHHAHIDQIWDQWQLDSPLYRAAFPGLLGSPMPRTLPGTTPTNPGFHVNLRESGVIYVKVQSSTSTTPPGEPLPPSCSWVITTTTSSSSGGGRSLRSLQSRVDDYRDRVYNVDEIEEAIYQLAANGTLSSVPQRPTYVPTIEELKNGFFWTSTEGSGLPEGLREERLIETRAEIIAANAKLQFPTTEFDDETSRMLGIDVGEVIARFNICPIGSEWIPGTGNCAAVDPATARAIQAELDKSVLFMGDIVRNEDVGASPSPSTSPTPDVLGSISGNVKGDENNDDVGDINVAGVPIVLLDSGGNVVATTVTDSNGDYAFYDVPVGSYSVTETNIASYPFDVSDADGDDGNVISVSIDGANGLNSTGNDFVDEPARTVSGLVLEDTDLDNVGDVPIPAVSVALIDDTGITVGNTVTGSDGVYTFTVPPGTYTVVQTNNPGYFDVSDSDGGDPNSITVDVSGSGGGTDNVFVDQRGSIVGGP